MQLSKASDFARGHHHAVMHTYRRDGQPQLSPVTVGVNEAGQLIVSTRETSVKVRNLRRDPRVSLCVFTDRFFGDWIQVDGTATLLALPDALEPLVEYYRSISGEHPDWDEYRQAMVRDQRLLVQVDVTRVGPDFHG
ncbi:PPOX class F420-dependent enzyme [Rhizocola hellebori]|uniref:PPOX class F420-dependent enzyme n=1 Tax=Rhizocola hellebori TaxID=1392758 RepID=A0A8J3QH10_9ACTN|nr:PPOX class F420-dependent oxidoreductase [Rhizocola hellebori]GIH09156.1 PPOX class F420-dependent enzyme [Rhizocola hellebori]